MWGDVTYGEINGEDEEKRTDNFRRWPKAQKHSEGRVVRVDWKTADLYIYLWLSFFLSFSVPPSCFCLFSSGFSLGFQGEWRVVGSGVHREKETESGVRFYLCGCGDWLVWFLVCRSEKMQRPTTRLMERSNTMTRGKRALDVDDEQPERKRPALARSVLSLLSRVMFGSL